MAGENIEYGNSEALWNELVSYLLTEKTLLGNNLNRNEPWKNFICASGEETMATTLLPNICPTFCYNYNSSNESVFVSYRGNSDADAFTWKEITVS
jgi:hypothetical protein